MVMENQGIEGGGGVQLKWSCWLQCVVHWMLCRVPEYCSEQLLFVQPPSRLTLRPHELQHARLPCSSLPLWVRLNSYPLSQWYHPTMSSCCPLLFLPSVFPSIRGFSYESALHIRWPKHWSFSISPSSEYSGLISFRINCFALLDVQGTLKKKESSPTPQFESISSSVLSLLYDPALTSIHDYWKNHSFD